MTQRKKIMWLLQQEIHTSWGLHCNDAKNHHYQLPVYNLNSVFITILFLKMLLYTFCT